MIEDILGSRNKIKLIRQLISSNDWHFNLSEIAKKSKLDKGSVSKIITEFEKNKIIEVNRSGKLLMFRLKPSYQDLAIKIFKIEKQCK